MKLKAMDEMELLIAPSYEEMSRIWISPAWESPTEKPSARLLDEPRIATAHLLEIVNQFRPQLKGIQDYDKFCEELHFWGSNGSSRHILDKKKTGYSVGGKSADWILPFQYAVNGDASIRVLLIHLRHFGRTDLPLDPNSLNELPSHYLTAIKLILS